MPTGYTRQSSASIVDGNTIYSSYFNAEYNKLEAAFDSVTGHNHDGTTGGGAPIDILNTLNTLTVARGGTGATDATTARVNLNLVIGSDVQAWNDNLDDLAALTHTDGAVIVSDGTNWVVETDATARASLGLGSIATQDATSINISGGNITGIIDLAVADGGTGASTAADARTNLSVYSKAEVDGVESGLDGKISDLSGVTDAATARTNLSVYSTTEVDTSLQDYMKNDGTTVPSGFWDWNGVGMTNFYVRSVSEDEYNAGSEGGTLTVRMDYGVQRMNMTADISTINFLNEVSNRHQSLLMRISNGATYAWTTDGGARTPSGANIGALCTSTTGTRFDDFIIHSDESNNKYWIPAGSDLY